MNRDDQPLRTRGEVAFSDVIQRHVRVEVGSHGEVVGEREGAELDHIVDGRRLRIRDVRLRMDQGVGARSVEGVGDGARGLLDVHAHPVAGPHSHALRQLTRDVDLKY